MSDKWIEFAGDVAWPAVALICFLLIIVTGELRKMAEVIAKNLLGIAGVVREFRGISETFQATVDDLKSSREWLSKDLQPQLSLIALQIRELNAATAEQVISEGSKSLSQSVGEDQEPLQESEAGLSVDAMFVEIRSRWDALTESMRAKIGAEVFDARMVGDMAWKLVDGRRVKPITAADAELIGQLHSQMKRFNRLQSTKDEWLTHEVYGTFVRGVEQAASVL